MKEIPAEVVDAPRGFLQVIRNTTGCTFPQALAHCEARGDDISLWPEWALEEQGYVSEAGAALFIYSIMTRASLSVNERERLAEQYKRNR